MCNSATEKAKRVELMSYETTRRTKSPGILEDGNMLAADPTYGRRRMEGEREGQPTDRRSDRKQWQRHKMNHDSSNRDSCAALLLLSLFSSPPTVDHSESKMRVSVSQ